MAAEDKLRIIIEAVGGKEAARDLTAVDAALKALGAQATGQVALARTAAPAVARQAEFELSVQRQLKAEAPATAAAAKLVADAKVAQIAATEKLIVSIERQILKEAQLRATQQLRAQQAAGGAIFRTETLQARALGQQLDAQARSAGLATTAQAALAKAAGGTTTALKAKADALGRTTNAMRTAFATVLGHPYFALSSALATTRGSLLALGVGAVAVASSLAFLLNRTSSYILFLRNMQFETNLSTQGIARMAAISVVTGAPLVQLGQAFRNLNNAIQGVGPAGREARRALEDLKIIRPGELVSTSEAFQRIAQRARTAGESVGFFNQLAQIFGDRFSVIAQAFVRADAQAGPGLDNLQRRFAELLSEENILRAQRFQIEWEALFLNLKIGASSALGPINSAIEALGRLFTLRPTEQQVQDLKRAIATLEEVVPTAAPQVRGQLENQLENFRRQLAALQAGQPPAVEAPPAVVPADVLRALESSQRSLLAVQEAGGAAIEKEMRFRQSILKLVEQNAEKLKEQGPVSLDILQTQGRRVVLLNEEGQLYVQVGDSNRQLLASFAAQTVALALRRAQAQATLAIHSAETSERNEVLRLEAQLLRTTGDLVGAVQKEQQISQSDLALRFERLRVQGLLDEKVIAAVEKELKALLAKVQLQQLSAEAERKTTDELLRRQGLRADELRAAQMLSDLQLQGAARLAREQLEMRRIQVRTLGLRVEGAFGDTAARQQLQVQEILLEGQARQLALEQEIARTKQQSLDIEQSQRERLNLLSEKQALLELTNEQAKRETLEKEIQDIFQLLKADEKRLTNNEALLVTFGEQGEALRDQLIAALEAAGKEGARQLQRDLSGSFAQVFDDMLIRGKAAFESLKNFAEAITQSILRTLFSRIGEAISKRIVDTLSAVADKLGGKGIVGKILDAILGINRKALEEARQQEQQRQAGQQGNTQAQTTNTQATTFNTDATVENTLALQQLTAVMQQGGIGAPGGEKTGELISQLAGSFFKATDQGGGQQPTQSGQQAQAGPSTGSRIFAGAAGAFLVATATQQESPVSGALQGAVGGAMVGTAIMPGIGTIVGAIVGALIGGLGSLFGQGAEGREERRSAAVEEALKKQAFEFLPQRQFRFADAGSIQDIFGSRVIETPGGLLVVPRRPGFTTGMRLAGQQPSGGNVVVQFNVDAIDGESVERFFRRSERHIAGAVARAASKSAAIRHGVTEIAFPA